MAILPSDWTSIVVDVCELGLIVGGFMRFSGEKWGVARGIGFLGVILMLVGLVISAVTELQSGLSFTQALLRITPVNGTDVFADALGVVGLILAVIAFFMRER